MIRTMILVALCVFWDLFAILAMLDTPNRLTMFFVIGSVATTIYTMYEVGRLVRQRQIARSNRRVSDDFHAGKFDHGERL